MSFQEIGGPEWTDRVISARRSSQPTREENFPIAGIRTRFKDQRQGSYHEINTREFQRKIFFVIAVHLSDVGPALY